MDAEELGGGGAVVSGVIIGRLDDWWLGEFEKSFID